MTTFGIDLIDSLNEALDHAKGKKAGMREHAIERAGRERVARGAEYVASQFRARPHIPLPTLEGWEQGRRQPDATAAAFLNVTARLPSETRAALQ